MKEIWKMWKLLCFFKKNRFSLALKLVDDNASSKAFEFRLTEVKQLIADREKELGRDLSDVEVKEISRKVEAENTDFEKYLAFREASSYHKEPRVSRKDLVYSYISHFDKELTEEYEKQDFDKRILNKDLQKKKIEINSIIQDCIDEPNSFIKLEGEKDSIIYLTSLGKKFATVDGLITTMSSELVKILGATKLVTITALSTASIVKGGWILNIIKKLLIAFK